MEREQEKPAETLPVSTPPQLAALEVSVICSNSIKAQTIIVFRHTLVNLSESIS